METAQLYQNAVCDANQLRVWFNQPGRWIDFAVSKDFVTVRTIKDPLRHWHNFPWAGKHVSESIAMRANSHTR
jgi:hypothetical protein